MKNKKITSQSALAKELGVSRQLISAHVLSGKAPPLADKAGWKVFLASLGRTGSMPHDQRLELAVERVRIARVTADRLELEHKLRLGQAMDLAEVRRHVADGSNWFWDQLEKLVREGSRTLLGLNSIDLRDALDRIAHDIKEGSRQRWGNADGTPYVRRPYQSTVWKFSGWTHLPSTPDERRLDALVAKNGCPFPKSYAEMEAMLEADDPGGKVALAEYRKLFPSCAADDAEKAANAEK